MVALKQTSYADARRMLLELEAWLRPKNESAADSLLEAFEELLTMHRLQGPSLLCKTLLSTNPIERMCSLVRPVSGIASVFTRECDAPRWLGAVLLYREQQINHVKGLQTLRRSWRPSRLRRGSRSPLRQGRRREHPWTIQKTLTDILTISSGYCSAR